MSFRYQNSTFTPVRKFNKNEINPDHENFIMRKIRSSSCQCFKESWDYEEFYKAAIASDPKLEAIDIFLWTDRNINVVPMEDNLYEVANKTN